MNEVMNIMQMQTPIDIALGIDENGMTTAKKLYEFLEMDKSNYSRWIRRNIVENEFAEEGVDYYSSDVTSEGKGNFADDYKLTASFAKKLSMMQKTQRGEDARKYFIKIEDKAKEMAEVFRNISPELKAALVVDKRVTKIESKVEEVDQDLQEFKRNLPLLPGEADLITSTINKVAVRLLGGKESNAYKDSSLRGKLYWDIHRELKRQFGVTKYKYIKSCQCDTAVSIINAYTPPLVLADQIKDCNAQMNMEVA